jgi:prepilin-type N-terminal cleavage/methylation domain-containing protein
MGSRQSAGFTLIELVVVLFIIGLVAALVVGPVSNQIKRSQRLSVATDVQALVRLVPVLSSRYACASRLHIDTDRQILEAWVCGELRRRFPLPQPFRFRLIDHAKVDTAGITGSIDVWYSPRHGGASLSLEVSDDVGLIRAVALDTVTAYHPES